MDFNNNERNNQDPNKRKKNKTNLLICLMAALFAIGLIFFLNSEIQRNTEKEITYTKFIEMLKKDQVKKVTFQSNMIVIEPKTKEKVAMLTVTYYTGYVNDEKLVQDLLNKYGVEFTAEIQSSSGIMDFLLSYILPIAGLWILLWFFMRSATKGGGIMGGVGKSNAKMYVEKKTGVTFKDVAGEEEAKESLTELVDFLKNPDKYKKIGARLPKGALLVGPPGTGKTLLAKALAGEAGVPFFSLSGSDFVEMFVGVGASRVRDLFKQATSMAPCIIFIDEIDAIGKSRDSQYGGGNDEREQTLNQLLSEMDGFDSSKGIIILGATNRPEVLDKALLRPGRFDRRIIVEKPDLKGRVDVLKVHSHDVLMDDTVDLEEIALATSGAVGADLANMVNEAAIMAVKDGRQVVSQKDLFEAVEVVLAGKEKKDRILGEEEKKRPVWTMCWKRWYDCVSCAFHGFFEDEKESSRLWVCQGIKLQFACIRGILEKGAKNQTLCGPDENDAAWSTGRLQNGLVRLSIPEDSEDHSGHLSADMTNHIHVMQTFGYFLFVIGLKHRITMHCYRGRQPNGTT